MALPVGEDRVTYDPEAWIKAWDGNKAMICNGVNDVQIKLPRLPRGFGWLLTRELTGEHPTYRLALLQSPVIFAVLARGKIDKQMYGEAGVQQLARAFMERLGINEPPPGETVERPRRPRRGDRGEARDEPAEPE